MPDGTFVPDAPKQTAESKPVFETMPPDVAAAISGSEETKPALAASTAEEERNLHEAASDLVPVTTSDIEKEGSQAVPAGALTSPLMGMLAKGNKSRKTSDKAKANAKEYADSDNNLNEKLMPAKIEAGTAGRIHNRYLTLAKGTFINCILETKVDTTVPGMTSCRIPENIYSMDGRTVLVEAGSRMFGEYRGALAQGQDRVFVLWTQIHTPYGVVVDLDSPGTDPLGGAGHTGEVDFHWWRRFGNALLFSLIDDSFNFATMKASERSDGVSYYTTSQDSMSELIKEAMKQTGQIPPTIRINQGSRIGIFTGQKYRHEFRVRTQAEAVRKKGVCAVTGRVDFSALSEFRKKVEKHLEETSTETDELNPQSAHRALNPGSPFQPTPDGNALPKDRVKTPQQGFTSESWKKSLPRTE